MTAGAWACGGDDSPRTTTKTVPAPAAGEGAAPGERAERGRSGEAGKRQAGPEPPGASRRPPASTDERRVARTVRAYVAGLRGRDGQAVCGLLAPGALEAVRLPRQRGGCSASLEASIGYRDPRGLPVWETARLAGIPSLRVEGDSASATATVVTRFADREQPSIEDDVFHLRRSAGRWLIAKASATLYRAVGIADAPPSVLAPP